jgi:hypothetical protein
MVVCSWPRTGLKAVKKMRLGLEGFARLAVACMPATGTCLASPWGQSILGYRTREADKRLRGSFISLDKLSAQAFRSEPYLLDYMLFLFNRTGRMANLSLFPGPRPQIMLEGDSRSAPVYRFKIASTSFRTWNLHNRC